MNQLTFQIFQEFKQIKWALKNVQANKDISDSSRAILKFTLNQTYDKQEYLTKWLVTKVQGKAKGETLNILGCALKNQNKIQEALQCFKEALPLCKGPSLINLTYTYSKLGKHEEALNYAIQSVNETQGKQKVIALHNAAVEYNSVGKKGLSQQYHQQAYDLSIRELGLENELTDKMAKYIQKRGGSAFRLRTKSKMNSSMDQGRTESDSETALKKTFKEDRLNQTQIQDFRVTKKRLSFHEPDKERQNRMKFLQDQLQQHIYSYGVSLSQSRELSHQFIKIEQHKLDLTDILQDVKKLNGPQTDMSYINDTKEETFYETHNLINHPDRAASKIQNWYRQKKLKVNKNIKINLSQLNQAAIKIQRQFRCKCSRDLYKLRIKSQQQSKKYRTALKIWNCDINKSVYNIVTAYRDNQTINMVIQQLKRKNKHFCQFDVDNIFKYYLFFEQFYLNHINDDYVKTAYNMKQSCQQGNIDLKIIIQLLYYQKGVIQLYGLTDVDIQPIDKSQIFTQTQIKSIDDQKIIKVQANARGFLVRNRKRVLKNYIKQFVCKLEQRYYFIRIYEDNQVKALDILKKTITQNKIKIPDILLRQNDFKLNSQTIQDIFVFENGSLQFNEDAKYTLMRLQKKKLNNTPIQLLRSITLIQKYYRVKRLRDVLQLRIKRRKMKESILYTVRKNTIFSNNGINYQVMLYALITQSNSQALTIGASVLGKNLNHPYFVKFVQRVFSIIHPEELQIIARISLDHVKFVTQENQILIQTTSIEEIKGNMLHKGMSDNQVQHYEPTFHGRNYFNKFVLTNQYLKNTIPLIDIEYEKINHDPKQYMVKHITNNLKTYYRQRNKRLAPQITDLATYINNFKGQVIEVQEIIDPQIIHDRLVQKMAKKILRSYKCYKFRKIMKKKIEARKERMRRNIKKFEIKEHYFQIIQKPSPYDTLQILDNLKEAYILLSEQNTQFRNQWILMIPSFDIIITVYCYPRQFYRIIYSDYHSQFLEKILQGSPEKIIQFFSGPIERNEPQNKQDFINDVHNQFAFKISRLVRIFMLKSQIRNLPDIKKVFVRQFITNNYYKISYHYLVNKQMILIYLSNEIKKENRSFQFELFQLDKLPLGRDRDLFLNLLCLEYRKNAQIYKQKMLPLINILHKFFKMDSDMNLHFEGIHFDMQEIQEKKQMQQQKQYKKSQVNVISLQTRWKMAIDRQVYKMRQKRAANMYRKLLSKKGRLMRRTFKQRCEFQDTNSKEMMLILIYFIGDLIDYHLKVEVMPYEKRKQKPFVIVQHFRFEKGMYLTNQLIHDHVLENLYIQDCNLILKNDCVKEISMSQSQQSETEQSELIYHQRRDYQDGSQFQFQSVYSGSKPFKNDDSIRIDVDLKQFRKRFPQLNYKKEDILPKLSEQIVDSIKIKDGKVLTKQFLNLKMKGMTKLSENGDLKQSKGINSKVLLRYSQIYKKNRYLITISIEEVPIDDSYEIMKHYDSNLIIRAVSVVKGKSIEWQMTGREAERLTGQKDPQLQAIHFKQNLSVLDDRMFYVANFEKLDFDNVLIMPFKVLYMIQRMIRNRKFRILRKLYEQEIQNIKERLSILIYYDICDFHSDENFITLVLDRKEYTIIAWNINNYKRYHLIVSKKFPKENFKQINHLITFKNDQLCM